MSLSDDQKTYLKSLDRKTCVHAGNMLRKANQDRVEEFFDAYRRFSENMAGNTYKSVQALNTYKDFAKDTNRSGSSRGIFSAQSKFEPTILEEFLARLFKREFGNDSLIYGPANAYSNLYFSYDNLKDFKEKGPNLRINSKNQDVAIFRSLTIELEKGESRKINLPIVCVECKTQLDKTMLEGAVATANKIKTGNPGCLFLIVTEYYEVDTSVAIDPAIDNIYVLRKQIRRDSADNRIDATVIANLLKEVKNHLQRSEASSSVKSRILEDGSVRSGAL